MRKLLVTIMLVLLIIGVYIIMMNGVDNGSIVIKSFAQVEEANSLLTMAIADVENKNKTLFPKKKSELDTALTNYQNAKNEYLELLPAMQLAMQESSFSGVDLYDIDFLWTIIGNYASEEGVVLKFDVKKSSVIIDEGQTPDNAEYVFCDLDFEVVGQYITITDFIYDLEDDDRLNFEIRNFKLVPGSEGDLAATFSVKSIPLNKRNLSNVASSEKDEGSEQSSSSKNPSSSSSSSSKNSSSSSSSKSEKEDSEKSSGSKNSSSKKNSNSAITN